MRVIHDLGQASVERETVLTIGTFDGLHLGHQSLLKRLMRSAQDADRLSGVVTFDPPPRMVLAPENGLICLTTIEDKIELLQAWGLDLLVIVPFTWEVARTSARDFVWPLCDRLRMVELWIGWDFALGRGREGDAPFLQRLGQEMGFAVHVVEPVTEGTDAISSTRIRNLLSAGRVHEAAEMLGRYYQIRGVVVPGVGQDRHVGYPTANLTTHQVCTLPGSGIYAAYATAWGKRYAAVANIGTRPTFGEGAPTVEVHLVDFAGDLQGELLRVEFVERLRDERRFANAKALRAQIKKDIIRAREILE
jgi:riboflavin kinase/FMN adenylyltransferase